MKGTWILDSNANANEIIISSAIIYNNQNNPNLENNIRSTFYASDLDILLKVNEAKLKNNSSEKLFSALRNIENAKPIAKASIYPIREALMWEKSMPLGLPGKAFQGNNYYTATNLDPEAIITYYYDESYKSLKEKRQKKEKELIKSESDTP